MCSDVAWPWTPSPLNAAAYLSAELMTIGENAFTASGTHFNCITLSQGRLAAGPPEACPAFTRPWARKSGKRPVRVVSEVLPRVGPRRSGA